MFYLSNKKLRLLIISLLLLFFAFFLGLLSPKAEATAPNSLEYNIGPNSTIATGSRSQVRYGFNTYSDTYCSSGTCTYIWSSIYGNAGQNSGKYFTYFMYTDQVLYNVVANIQLTSGDYVACQVASNITNNKIINAICDLSSFQNNVGVYKYGFNWQNDNLVYSSSYEISKLYYFNTSAENQQQINNINNNVSNISNSINDSSIDTNNASSSASTWNSKNATNGTITQLLTLPITLLQAIVNGLQTSCSSFSLGSLFGTNINLPCINVGNLIGSGLWTTIDILFSGFMILAIAKKLIKIFNDFTNLKSNQIDELYGGGNK